MRNRIGLALVGLLAAVGISLGVALAVGLPGTVAAGDPSPPPGMHQACERMAPEAMESMHEGMMNAGADGRLDGLSRPLPALEEKA
jgi:hypothetical protein